MSITHSELELYLRRSFEFTSWLNDEAYGKGPVLKHDHYTRFQSKKHGLPYLMWHTMPHVRSRVMARVQKCFQLLEEIQELNASMKDGQISVELCKSQCKVLKEKMNVLECTFLSIKSFYRFMDDETSLQINQFLWKLSDAHFVALCNQRTILNH